MVDIKDFVDTLMSYVCINCKKESEENCNKCEKEGTYKEVSKMIDNLIDTVKDDIEYDQWEQNMGDDL